MTAGHPRSCFKFTEVARQRDIPEVALSLQRLRDSGTYEKLLKFTEVA